MADVATQIDALKAELALLTQQQAAAQTTNDLLQQLVQKLDTGKGKKIWVDKPEKFDGKIGNQVNNWLKGWELWFKHREAQDGAMDPRTKIETAMLCTKENVKNALVRHEREHGKWNVWTEFKKDMKSKY